MKRRVSVALALALCLGLAAIDASAQKPPKCTPDVPLDVTIVPMTGSVLGGDTKGNVYKDGVDGVVNTVIRRCSGSNDATMGLITSRRSMEFDFSDVAGSMPYTKWPNWTLNADGTYSQFLTKPFLNVRNILWGRMYYGYPANQGPFTFKTRMSIGYIKGPGDKSDYVLRFMPDINPPDGPSAVAPDPFIDNATVPVTVVDTPSTCTWTVTVDDPFVGVLYKTSTEEHAGQFYMPFKLQLKTKACPF